MNPLKEAFSKIKEDILSLKNEIIDLKVQIKAIQTTPTHNSLNTPQQTNKQTNIQTTPTHKQDVEPLYTDNFNSSIGNQGVPTDKQTNRQTDKQTGNYIKTTHNSEFKQVSDILESLDNIKKGIRLKFKRLTSQEMFVFSVLYSMEEQKIDETTYRSIATKLNLSESSIRDYINRLIKKGVPIEKIRQNNKIIILKISKDLKNIATLATIQNLREL